MEHRFLGRSGFKVPAQGFGAGTFDLAVPDSASAVIAPHPHGHSSERNLAPV